MFKNLTQFAQLLRGSSKLTERIQAMKSDLGKKQIERKGADSVVVQMNGLGQVQRITIASHLVQSDHQSHLEECISQTINEALQESRRLHLAAFRELTGGMDIPGLDQLIADLD